MSTADVAGIAPGAIDAMRSRERVLYEKKHPRSRELAAATAGRLSKRQHAVPREHGRDRARRCFELAGKAFGA